MANEISRPLSSFFTFSAINNTIVENTARSTIFYDNTGNSSLAYNVLAFNQGLSCEYALNGGNPSKEQEVDFLQYIMQLS